MVRFNPAPAIRRAGVCEHDAIACLTRDHAVIRRLFRYYEHLAMYGGDNEKKAETAGQICLKWCIHIQIEEEIFYPVAKVLLGGGSSFQHALDDHAGSCELVAMLDELEPGDANFDPTVAVLAAYVLLHMDAEEDALFPRLRQLGMETTLLGQAIAQRQRMLSGDITHVGQARPRRLTQSGDVSGAEPAQS